MKKIFGAAMSVVLVLALTACSGANAEDNAVTMEKIEKLIVSTEITENADGSGSINCYDADGVEICTKLMDKDGNLQAYFLYTRDEAGNVVRRTRCMAGDIVDRYTDYEYDANGNRTRMEVYDAENKMITYSVYEYDEKGNILRETDYNTNGLLDDKYEFEYDAEGNISLIRNFTEDDMVDYENEFDADGVLLRINWYRGTGSLQTVAEPEYNEAGVAVINREYYADGKIKTVVTNDENGKPLTKEDYNKNGIMVCYSTYGENEKMTGKTEYSDQGVKLGYSEYDENGQIVKIEIYNPDGTVKKQ